MTRINALLLVVVLGTASITCADNQEKAGFDAAAVKQKFDSLLPAMGARDIGARHGPQQQWQEVCYKAGAPGNEAMRLEVCKLMIGKLGTDTPNPARLWLLKQLEFLGRGESVDRIAAVISDKDRLVHDAAVRALANNPAPQATEKLLAKLPGTSGTVKIGLINALAFRADQSALPALIEELRAEDAKIASASARALGKIGTPDAAAALAAALKHADDGRRRWIADAYLLCADHRLKEGKSAQAAAMYKQLQGEKNRSIRLASLQGILRTSGDDAGKMILELIAGKDVGAREIAIGQIESINAAALKPLAANLDKMPATGQVMVLTALGARGDKSHVPAVLAAIKSPDPSIQRAGLLALGRLGDASVVPLLIDTLFAGPKHSDAAKESLVNLSAPEVNQKIIIALKAEKNPGRRVTLMSILADRRATSAAPVLLQDARGPDAGLRKSAMAALRQLAEPEHVPALVEALFKTEKGGEREEAELTIVAVCSKILEKDKRAEPVLNIYQKEGPAERLILLPLLGKLGHFIGLNIIKEALTGNDDKMRAAAVQGLCNWPDPSVSDDLLALIKNAKEPAHRQLALRSLVRVSSVPSEQSYAFKLEKLKSAMSLAENDDERRLVLEGLARAKDIRTLRYVVPYLDKKDLAQAACKTIVELAHSRTLREPNQAEFVQALDRVVVICRDKGLIDRARKYKQGY